MLTNLDLPNSLTPNQADSLKSLALMIDLMLDYVPGEPDKHRKYAEDHLIFLAFELSYAREQVTA